MTTRGLTTRLIAAAAATGSLVGWLAHLSSVQYGYAPLVISAGLLTVGISVGRAWEYMRPCAVCEQRRREAMGRHPAGHVTQIPSQSSKRTPTRPGGAS